MFVNFKGLVQRLSGWVCRSPFSRREGSLLLTTPQKQIGDRDRDLRKRKIFEMEIETQIKIEREKEKDRERESERQREREREIDRERKREVRRESKRESDIVRPVLLSDPRVARVLVGEYSVVSLI